MLVHGWGLDPALWRGVRAGLALGTTALDLGYGSGASACPGPAAIGIGHSFGALWLLRRQAQTRCFRALILINGFARFTVAPDWPHGTPPRVLAQMARRFATEPRPVLDAFRARCGLPPWAGAFDPHRLAADLDHLAAWDLRETLAGMGIPALWLAAEDDPLVPVGSTQASAALGPASCAFARGGHVLPLTAPSWCAARIQAFVDAL